MSYEKKFKEVIENAAENNMGLAEGNNVFDGLYDYRRSRRLFE